LTVAALARAALAALALAALALMAMVTAVTWGDDDYGAGVDYALSALGADYHDLVTNGEVGETAAALAAGALTALALTALALGLAGLGEIGRSSDIDRHRLRAVSPTVPALALTALALTALALTALALTALALTALARTGDAAIEGPSPVNGDGETGGGGGARWQGGHRTLVLDRRKEDGKGVDHAGAALGAHNDHPVTDQESP
jgi:hypothetical protein